MMARMPATGRGTVLPPVPVSRTVRLNNCPSRQTDALTTENRLYPSVCHPFLVHAEPAYAAEYVSGVARHQGLSTTSKMP